MLRSGLEAILRRYASARPGEPFGRDHDLYVMFEDLHRALSACDAVRACPTIRVEWSAGKGGLARIPSIAFLDIRETTSARRGLSVGFLLPEDRQRVCLILGFGTAESIERLGRKKGREALAQRVDEARPYFGDLEHHRFHLASDLVVGSSPSAEDYRHATVAYTCYQAGQVPGDRTINDELATLLHAYTQFISARTDRDRIEPVTWLFGFNPSEFDLEGAAAELSEIVWPVREYQDWIHPGDTVYLCETGDAAAIVATATALSDAEAQSAGDTQSRFVRDPAFVRTELGVRLRVAALPERLAYEGLNSVATLESLPKMRASGGRIYPITPEQTAALERLAGPAASGLPRAKPRPTPTVKRLSNQAPFERFDRQPALDALISAISDQGFVFDPWQVAAYATALRTKPFVILAGVSGTGKSRLPLLASTATGAVARVFPVRPDWTDSSDVLGYVDLRGRFRPGALLELARDAADRPDTQFVAVMDEMNLARVEHYFAEVLSRIEAPEPDRSGIAREPLLVQSLDPADHAWQTVALPPNLSLVGTVNMDESAHGFSRKVLDRAFTIEFSDIDLSSFEPASAAAMAPRLWPASAWRPRAAQLAVVRLTDDERPIVERAVGALTQLNAFLVHANLQVGYRTRDEVALFCLHAREVERSFATRTGERVDPLDLALLMKVLPRIAGGSAATRRILLRMLGWALDDSPLARENDADPILDEWTREGCPSVLARARFPRTAARLCLMWERVLEEGFTSFWS